MSSDFNVRENWVVESTEPTVNQIVEPVEPVEPTPDQDQAAVRMMRKALRRHRGFPEGTVVRYQHQRGANWYLYAAIYVRGWWYLTSSTTERALSNTDFLRRLTSTTVRQVSIATGWERVQS